MATFTITTEVNIDSLAGKTGSDIYNINGGHLIIDQDSQTGVNQSTTTCMGNIIISPTLGGKLTIDGRKIRLIPYNSGTGTVPAWNTVISQGGAEGLLIGVITEGTYRAAGTSPGASVPTTGWLKIKQWNDVPFGAGALTGIGATATGPDFQGTLLLFGNDSSYIQCPALGQVDIKGEWAYAGETTGSQGATTDQIAFASQYSSNMNRTVLPGVQVETGIGTNEYEWYPTVGDFGMGTTNFSNDSRSKYCATATSNTDSRTGRIYFADNGTLGTGGGHIPSAGRKVRIPNIILATSSANTPTTPNATVGTRYRILTTGSGNIKIDKASCIWYANMKGASSIELTNSAFLSQIYIENNYSPATIDNCCVGLYSATNHIAFRTNTANFGGTVTNSKFLTRAGTICFIEDSSNWEFDNCYFASATLRTSSTTNGFSCFRSSNIIVKNTTLGGYRLQAQSGTNLTIQGIRYFDSPVGVTSTANATAVIDLSNNYSNVSIEDIGWIENNPTLANGSSIVQFSASGVNNVKIRNIGTPESPLLCGGPVYYDVPYTRSSTTITVTLNDHGLSVGQPFVVFNRSVTANITIGAKTVATVPNANTFTFVGTNSGATSGVVSFYPATTTTLIGQAAYATDVYVQRCYLGYTRARPFVGFINTSRNILWENAEEIPSVKFPATINTSISSSNTQLYGTSGNDAWQATTNFGAHIVNMWLNSPTEYDSNGENVFSTTFNRATTTFNVDYPDHDLVQLDSIYVAECPDNPVGAWAAQRRNIPNQGMTRDVFAYTGTNTGATSGSIKIKKLTGAIFVCMNGPTGQTSNFVTIQNGTPAFTGTGLLSMPNVDDEITIESQRFIRGVIGLDSVRPIFDVPTNPYPDIHTLYSIDLNDGNGWSEFKNLRLEKTATEVNLGWTSVLVSDKTNINVGDYVFGAGIAHGARVDSIDESTNRIYLTKANVATQTGDISFSNAPNEIIDPHDGFKIRVKLKTLNTNTHGLGVLKIYTKSTRESRNETYPFDMAELEITGLEDLTDVVILQPGTSNEYLNVDQNVGDTFTWLYDAGDVSSVDIGLFKQGFVPYFIRNLNLTDKGASIPVKQIPDRNYNPNG